MFPEVNRNKNIGEKGVNMNSQVFRQYLAQMSFNQELVCVQSCHCQIAHLQGCLLMQIHQHVVVVLVHVMYVQMCALVMSRRTVSKSKHTTGVTTSGFRV